MSHEFSEDKLVQETTANYFKDNLNWESIYAYNDENQQTNYGSWAIVIHSKYKKPFLKFFTKKQYGEADKQIVNDIIQALGKVGINNYISKQQDGFNLEFTENA